MVLVIRYEIHRPIKGPETDRSAKSNWQSLAASVMLQLWMVAERLTPLVELISATDPMWPCLPHPTPPPTPQKQSSPKILHETMRVKKHYSETEPEKENVSFVGEGGRHAETETRRFCLVEWLRWQYTSAAESSKL